MVKLLLNYGGTLSEENRKDMTSLELNQVDNYAKFNKLRKKLNNQLENRKESKAVKI